MENPTQEQEVEDISQEPYDLIDLGAEIHTEGRGYQVRQDDGHHGGYQAYSHSEPAEAASTPYKYTCTGSQGQGTYQHDTSAFSYTRIMNLYMSATIARRHS